MPDYGLLPTGFIRKPLSVIDNEVEAKLRTISPLITLEADDPFGEAIKVLTGKVGEVWEVAEAVNASQNPDVAGGAALDALGALTGTRRRADSKSTVTATVNLDAGTSIAAGDAVASVDGNPNATFVNTEPMVNAGATTANFPVAFQAEDTGPVVASAGTLTKIDTILSGWNAIINATDAVLGEVIEVDGPMRLRREQELESQGGGTFDGMRGDVSKLTGITSVRIYENDTDLVDAYGLPAHSFEVVIDGSGYSLDELAQTIWGNKPLGIKPYGASYRGITDEQGEARSIGYTVATQIPIDVNPWWVSEGGIDPADEAAAYSAALAASGVGTTVYATTLVCALLDVAGIVAVGEVRIRRDADAYGSTVAMGRTERPVLGTVVGP